MEKTTFILTNSFDQNIDLSFEPEGITYELSSEESIEIEISAGFSPSISLQLAVGSNNKICMSIWHEKGRYKIV